MRRTAGVVAAVAAAILAQVTVVDRLPLPGGAGPDLVLVLVVALALATGPTTGMVVGFAAGLAADAAPPASHLLGQSALVLCLVGYVCGRMRPLLTRSSWLPLAALAVGVAGGESLYAAVGLMFGDPDITWVAIRQVVPWSIAYDLLVSPFILYGMVRLGRYEAWAGRGRSDLLAGPEVAAARAGAAGLAAPEGAVRDTRGGRAPKLGAASARPGDGWIGRQPGGAGEVGAWVRRRRPLRLRLRGGVPGSAAGGPRIFAGRSADEHRMGRGSFRGAGRGVIGAGDFGASAAGYSGPAGRAKIRAAAFQGGGFAPARPRWRAARIPTRAFRGGKSALAAPGWRPGRPGLRLRRRRRDGMIGGSVLGRGVLGRGGAGLGANGWGANGWGGAGLRPGSFTGSGGGAGGAGPLRTGRTGSSGLGSSGLGSTGPGAGLPGGGLPGGRRMREPRSGTFSGSGGLPTSAAAFLARRAPGAGGPLRIIRPVGGAPRFRRTRWTAFRWLAAALPGRRDELDRLGRRGGLGGVGRRRGFGALAAPGRRGPMPGRRRGALPALRMRLRLGRGDGVIGGSVLGPRDALERRGAPGPGPGGSPSGTPSVTREGGQA